MFHVKQKMFLLLKKEVYNVGIECFNVTDSEQSQGFCIEYVEIKLPQCMLVSPFLKFNGNFVTNSTTDFHSFRQVVFFSNNCHHFYFVNTNHYKVIFFIIVQVQNIIFFF